MAAPAQSAPLRHRVPAEEAPHEATFLQWPVHRRVYRDRWFLEDVQATILRIAHAIAAFEPVILLANADHHGALRRRLRGDITLWDIPTDDLWCRDSGPLVTVDSAGRRALSHIRFNGWGRKQTHRNDARIARRVAARLGFNVIESGLTGEPGGVEQDGHGNLLAHESSWVIANRNPGLGRDEIGARLMAAYGADRIVWSRGVKHLDITDYHVDSLARFTARRQLIANLPDPPVPGDPFDAAGRATVQAARAAGWAVDVIAEPRRPRINSPDFVGAYVNFYVCNGAVIAPEFGDRDTDTAAARALGRHFPGREVVQIAADALGELGGGIHCATQQLPAG